MKAMLSFCLLLALATLAQAQDRPVPAKPLEPPPVLNLNKSQWQLHTARSSDGMYGSATTTIKRHIGPGLWLGGQMKSPYRESALGGQGAPSNPVQGVLKGTTMFGPVLEMRF